jgi:Heavy metal binding domain
LRLLIFLLLVAFAFGQEPPVDFVCPMDPDVHSATPGKCPRCGMTLVPGIPDPIEYDLKLSLKPVAPKPGVPVVLAFKVVDPRDAKQVKDFQIVHERLFHMFLVSQDLDWFVHDHPALGKDGVFRYTAKFPKPGMYRILTDFYPKGGTPQLLTQTVIVPGAPLEALGVKLQPEVVPQKAGNMTVELVTDPAQPIAGMKTLMFFKVDPSDGLEPYLGAWGHMLVASEDLIDTIHTHPFLTNGGPQIQFNMIFPRPGVYRVWVQFQRKGIVNTVKFDIPVTELK